MLLKFDITSCFLVYLNHVLFLLLGYLGVAVFKMVKVTHVRLWFLDCSVSLDVHIVFEGCNALT